MASRALEWGAVWEPSLAVAALRASGRAGALQERSAYVGVQQQHRARGEQRELSVVDGRPVNWSKSIVARRRRRAMQHVAPLLTMLVAFVAALIVVILLKKRLGDDARAGKISAAVATGAPSRVCVAVQVLNIGYKYLAVFLTDRENWRTEVEYERQLVVKMAAFQLVNSFGACSTTRPSLSATCRAGVGCNEEADDDDDEAQGDACIALLRATLQSLYFSQLVVSNLSELALPMLMQRVTKHREGGLGRAFSRAELEFQLAAVDPLLGSISAFSSLAVEFGYLTLFVAVFPLAPLLSYVNMALGLRTNCYVLAFLSRRPFPTPPRHRPLERRLPPAAYASVATNAALLVFAANVPALAGARPGTKLWVFVAVQYALFGLMTLVDILVPDTTFSYDVQIARGELFRKRVIEEQVGDDDDDDDDDEDEEAAHGAARVSDVADVRVHERPGRTVPIGSATCSRGAAAAHRKMRGGRAE